MPVHTLGRAGVAVLRIDVGETHERGPCWPSCDATSELRNGPAVLRRFIGARRTNRRAGAWGQEPQAQCVTAYHAHRLVKGKGQWSVFNDCQWQELRDSTSHPPQPTLTNTFDHAFDHEVTPTITQSNDNDSDPFKKRD